MSIYSGFSNRKLQDKYNQCLKQLLTLMNQIIITTVKTNLLSKFKSPYSKLQQQLQSLDTVKFSQPKFSTILEPLTDLFQNIDGGKEWNSEPEKIHKTREYTNRGKRMSLDQNRKTISFYDGHYTNNKNSIIKSQHNNPHTNKSLTVKQSRYPPSFPQSQPLNPANTQPSSTKSNTPLRSMKIYRSRPASHHLINPVLQNDFSLPETDITMEELMRKNPLVERKMSAQKKRKIIKYEFQQIREEDQEGQGEVEFETERNKFQPQSNYHTTNYTKYSSYSSKTSPHGPFFNQASLLNEQAQFFPSDTFTNPRQSVKAFVKS